MNDHVMIDFLDFAMSVDDENKSDGGGGKSWPEFPDEKPSKVSVIDWLNCWEEELAAHGYGALLRDGRARMRPRSSRSRPRMRASSTPTR